MKKFLRLAGAAVLAAAGFVNAQAATLAADGSWQEFTVSGGLFGTSLSGGNEWIDSSGAALSYTFTIDAGFVGSLTVVDTGFAGDTFKVYNGSSQLGLTSGVPVVFYDTNPDVITDPSQALGNSSFSRATFVLNAGTYSINGVLDQSVLLDSVSNEPLNSTIGDVRLTVTPVPEPETFAMLLAGLGLIGAVTRRRRA